MLDRVALVLLAGISAGTWMVGPGVVGAQEMELGADALLELAEHGDARAAFLLGSRFAARGGDDDAEAVRWFRRAAEGGLAEGQYNLGMMIASGRGAARDDAEAARWFERAARQELPQAQFNLASFYATGRGVPQDVTAAAAWFERAAAAGLAQAQHNLGLMYEHGLGVSRDVDKAIGWYAKASDGGFQPARARHDALLAGRAGAGGTAEPGAGRAAPAPEAAPQTRVGPDAQRWIAAQNPETYTLQLASFLDPAQAVRFARRDLPGLDAVIYTATKRGERWHSVIHGAFPDRQAAREAISTLPERARGGDPWIRRLGAVRGEIERADGRAVSAASPE